MMLQYLCVIRGTCPTTPAPGTACGVNQRRWVCGTPCEPTCATPNPTCVKRCVANVCQCSEGYIRYTGVCIPKSACPTPAPTPYPPIVVVPIYQSPPVYTCPVYQTYAQCVPCERACNTPYYLCYQYCVPGCTCQPGFVRDTTTNNCINSYYCPRYRTYNRKAIKVQNADINRN
ncbi:hypothetical protein RB195_002726 [Necator americanus]|uniref:TIL domain-containing protein n=1 Tax=Necator americanus TaxID=51031 RepID=A0ABR1DKD6_NECAM